MNINEIDLMMKDHEKCTIKIREQIKKYCEEHHMECPDLMRMTYPQLRAFFNSFPKLEKIINLKPMQMFSYKGIIWQFIDYMHYPAPSSELLLVNVIDDVNEIHKIVVNESDEVELIN